MVDISMGDVGTAVGITGLEVQWTSPHIMNSVKEE
jgi:hypothetical protein